MSIYFWKSVSFCSLFIQHYISHIKAIGVVNTWETFLITVRVLRSVCKISGLRSQFKWAIEKSSGTAYAFLKHSVSAFVQGRRSKKFGITQQKVVLSCKLHAYLLLPECMNFPSPSVLVRTPLAVWLNSILHLAWKKPSFLHISIHAV